MVREVTRRREPKSPEEAYRRKIEANRKREQAVRDGDARPALALRALEAARVGDVRLERVTHGREPDWFEWKVATAHLLGLADASPHDLEVTLAVGLVAIGAGRRWSEEATEARAAAMRSA